VPLCRRSRDAERLGRLVQAAAGEEAQLDHLGLLRVQPLKLHEDLVQGQQIQRVILRRPGRGLERLTGRISGACRRGLAWR
jgi:hypothetical protein